MEKALRLKEIAAYSPMKFVNEELFLIEKSKVLKNERLTCCFEYSERWAQLMQEKNTNGGKLENIYQNANDEIDELYGITGPMFNIVTQILLKHWVNGKKLITLLKRDSLSAWHPKRWYLQIIVWSWR